MAKSVLSIQFLASCSCCSTTPLSSELTMKTLMFSVRSLHEKPMLMAVSGERERGRGKEGKREEGGGERERGGRGKEEREREGERDRDKENN